MFSIDIVYVSEICYWLVLMRVAEGRLLSVSLMEMESRELSDRF